MYPQKSSINTSLTRKSNHLWDNFSNNNPSAAKMLQEFNESLQKECLGLRDESELVEKKNLLVSEPSPKYRLECCWSFWFYRNGEQNWKDNLLFITDVDFVEEFWCVFNYLKPVSELSNGRDYMFFKKGIKPMWEDLENIDGGRWLHTFDKSQESIKLLENCWMNTLLSLIGSQYEEENMFVNGAVLNIRHKFNKLALWTNNQKNTHVQNKIGKRFKRFLNVKNTISFEPHKKELFLAATSNQTHEKETLNNIVPIDETDQIFVQKEKIINH